MGYTAQRIVQLFRYKKESELSIRKKLESIQSSGVAKLTERRGQQGREARLKSWELNQIPLLGEKFGFLTKKKQPKVYCFFVTKGGVLKSSLALNFARVCALHNIKTCVVGLDMQGDLTTALGYKNVLDPDLSFSEAIKKLNSIKGLSHYFRDELVLDDIILPTDLNNLKFIPETPELISMEQSLLHRSRRESWLSDSVLSELKQKFDLIVLDCSPNWNQLITNALVGCDVLVSPLECKINNFRNFKMFETFITEFKKDLRLNFQQIYVPTRYSQNRKLSGEILKWYQGSLAECTRTAVKDSVQGEEAIAMHCSVPEYAPGSPAAIEMSQLIRELWSEPSRIKLVAQGLKKVTREVGYGAHAQ